MECVASVLFSEKNIKIDEKNSNLKNNKSRTHSEIATIQQQTTKNNCDNLTSNVQNISQNKPLNLKLNFIKKTNTILQPSNHIIQNQNTDKNGKKLNEVFFT